MPGPGQGEPQHLQMRLDSGQRRAQFVRGIIGEAALALECGVCARQQVAHRVHQRPELGRAGKVGQGAGIVGSTPRQHCAQLLQRLQAAADAGPQQQQAGRQSEHEGHSGGQSYVAQQALA